MLDEAPKQAGLKDPVVSGDLQFTVNSIKCGITKVGPGFLEEKPQGQFCRVNLTVENVGDEEATIFGDEQKLVDNEDREFSYDAGATISAKQRQQRPLDRQHQPRQHD